MSLLVNPRSADDDALTVDSAWAHDALAYARFQHRRIAAGHTFRAATGASEQCLVLLGGRASVVCGDARFDDIGERADVFEQVPPYSVYAPADVDYAVDAHTELELAICSAPGANGHAPRLIEPGEVARSTRGEGTNVRHVHDILPETEPAASLLVVEVYTPAGHWSSYPPHKHDVNNLPTESQLEESYYHRLNPANGFAVQRVYSDDRTLDQTMAVGDGACVIVPRGYHPVGAPHGYDLYYLNVMAGPKRAWRFTTDPDFAWLVA